MSAPGLRLRESPRVAVAGRARLLLGAGGTTVDATMLDLSNTGMGLATAVAVPKPSVGDSCAFELALDGVRIEGRGVVMWSRRARPDRGDAPNVGIRFQQLDGAALRDLAGMVEPRLAAGRWSAVAEPALAASAAVVAAPEAASPPAQQLTLSVPAPASPLPAAAVVSPVVAIPTAVAVSLALATSPTVVVAPSVATTSPVETPPQAAPREPAPPKPASEPVVLAARPALAPPPTAPIVAPPGNALDDERSPRKNRAVMWIALAAAAVVIALLVKFLVPDRGEAEAPAAAPVVASVDESREPVDAPALGDVTGVSADESATGEAAAEEAAVEEVAIESSTGESAAMEAEAAAIAATRGDLVAESHPIANPVEPATVPARESAAAVTAAATLESRAVADNAAAPAAAASARARRLVALDHGVDGSTEVLAVRFDVPFAREDVFGALIGPDPPRYLLRLRGIERQWRPPEVQVGSPLVQRVRTGLHSTPGGPELHIVVDLGTRAVEHSWAIEGDTLRLRLTPRAP